MAETAAFLVDNVLPQQPVRPWVPSLPFALRYLLATRPEDFIARLAALVQKPRAHMTSYHGGFAPASPDRARVGFTRTTHATGPLSRQDRFIAPRYRTRRIT